MDALDPYRAAKIMLDQHGADEARSILVKRAVSENEAGHTEMLSITRAVLVALTDLTRERHGAERYQ